MSIRFPISFCVVGALAAASVPAAAKPGDKAWTQCVWSQAPDSAVRWLSMPVPTWQSSYAEANVLLGHRLIALCDSVAADPLRPNRMPNWKSLAAALRRSKPKVQTPSRASASVEILLCESAVENEGRASTYLYEVVRRSDGKEIISFRQYYAEAQGRALKLPQDLRILPKDGSRLKRSCRAIGAGGELGNA